MMPMKASMKSKPDVAVKDGSNVACGSNVAERSNGTE
jgi:hypothetical protein